MKRDSACERLIAFSERCGSHDYSLSSRLCSPYIAVRRERKEEGGRVRKSAVTLISIRVDKIAKTTGDFWAILLLAFSFSSLLSGTTCQTTPEPLFVCVFQVCNDEVVSLLKFWLRVRNTR